MQRLTRPMTRALAAFLASPRSWRHGYDLMKDAELSSGTLYPLLARLLDDGWLESRWEESAFPGRPPRQMYRVTANGRAMAKDAVAAARPDWNLPKLAPRTAR